MYKTYEDVVATFSEAERRRKEKAKQERAEARKIKKKKYKERLRGRRRYKQTKHDNLIKRKRKEREKIKLQEKERKKRRREVLKRREHRKQLALNKRRRRLETLKRRNKAKREAKKERRRIRLAKMRARQVLKNKEKRARLRELKKRRSREMRAKWREKKNAERKEIKDVIKKIIHYSSFKVEERKKEKKRGYARAIRHRLKTLEKTKPLREKLSEERALKRKERQKKRNARRRKFKDRINAKRREQRKKKRAIEREKLIKRIEAQKETIKDRKRVISNMLHRKNQRKYFGSVKYQMHLFNNHIQMKHICSACDLKGIYDEFEEFKDQSNEVVFPKKFHSYGTAILPLNYELVILKLKEDNNDDYKPLLQNDYGEFVEHTITRYDKYGGVNTNPRKKEWEIYDKAPFYVEETFWVYGHHPSWDRRTCMNIYTEYIEDFLMLDKYNFVKVLVYKNKLIIDQSSDFTFVICKCPADCIRLYNKLYEICTKNKMKKVFWANQITKNFEKEYWIDKIQKKTNWTRAKITRTETKHSGNLEKLRILMENEG